MSETEEKPLPDWERILSAAAHLQSLVPDTVLVGGTAAALYAGHRRSMDADHVLENLKDRFDRILQDLESVAGWKTTRITRPVLILGSLNGIETGIRQLIRSEPLEKTQILRGEHLIEVPTQGEILRIKAILILKRNTTRDYLDFSALAHHMGMGAVMGAMQSFDRLYPQPNEASALQQLTRQLGNPNPCDLSDIDLRDYKGVEPHWQRWDHVVEVARFVAACLLEGEAPEFREEPTSESPAPGQGGRGPSP